MNSSIQAWLETFATQERFIGLGQALMTLVLGLVAARVLRLAVMRLLEDRLATAQARLASRLAGGAIVGLTIVSVLRQLGIDLTLFVGAAGVLTVAAGFAAQTAASNLISGLFLTLEKPFSIGDTVEVGTILGEIVDTNVMSSKIRTFDNREVRLPNETLLKSSIVNYSRYPIRRIDLQFSLRPDPGLNTLEKALGDVADALPKCLDEPRPLFFVSGLVDGLVNVQYSVWTASPNFIRTRTELYLRILGELEEEGLSLGAPRRVLEHPSESTGAIEPPTLG